MKVLNLETFPISESILYEMIHQRHQYQRNEMLRKKKDKSMQANEIIRRHRNSRRKEVI